MTSDFELDLIDVPDSDDVPPTIEGGSGDRRRRRRRSRNRVQKLFRRMRHPLRWRWIVIAVVIVAVVSTLSASVMITDAIVKLESSWQGLRRVINLVNTRDGTELTLSDFNRLQSSLRELSRQLNTTRNRVGFAMPITQLNPEWQTSIEALGVAQQLASATQSMLSGLQPALNFMVEGEEKNAVATRISSGERVVELLELGRGSFIQAEGHLQRAEMQLDQINFTDVSSDLVLQIEQLRGFRNQLQNLNDFLLQSPDILTTLLGLDAERTYLVLAQNNDEIRPSGGYISTYGWFTVRGGRIIDFDYSPTTATSPNPPDDDFLDTFDVPDWWIQYRQPIYAAWDGSWYADFPSTAQLAMSYYNAGGNPQAPVDGVLAIDITGFQLLLAAMGEVLVEDRAISVTAETFRDVVYDIRAFGEGVQPHKEFVADVYASIFEEWQSINQERTPDLLGALLEGVQSRHVMIYFANPEINNTIGQIGWNGAQTAGIDHDYILVADANLGNKSNNSVIRSFTYDVEILPGGSLQSRLSLGYEYFASLAQEDPAIDDEFHGPLDYNNLLQIFLPIGTTIQETDDFRITTLVESETHTQLITRTTVEYDSGERYQIEYEVPTIVDTVGDYQRYRLLMQKQPGARTQAINLQITLPEDARVVSSSPQADASYNLEKPILDYRLNLDGDQWIEVIYQVP